MPTLYDILNKPLVTAPLHPRLRNWTQRIHNGSTVQIEVFRPAIAFGTAPSELSLHFTENGKLQPVEVLNWDDDLNAGLIVLKVRAIDASNEAERFALGLRAAFRKVERDFGDGYFNSVLHELIQMDGLAFEPDIAEIVKHVHTIPPNRDSKNYDMCREMIHDAIIGRMYELNHMLGYQIDEARKILFSAIARYLDIRFSVSNRRQLGVL